MEGDPKEHMNSLHPVGPLYKLLSHTVFQFDRSS